MLLSIAIFAISKARLTDFVAVTKRHLLFCLGGLAFPTRVILILDTMEFWSRRFQLLATCVLITVSVGTCWRN